MVFKRATCATNKTFCDFLITAFNQLANVRHLRAIARNFTLDGFSRKPIPPLAQMPQLHQLRSSAQ